jgi:hypothetical protein
MPPPLPRPQPAHYQQFRKWLVAQLVQSRWSYPQTVSLSELSLSLGVQESVIEEALAARAALLQARGQVDGRGKKATPRVPLQVTMPEAISRDWKQSCLELGVNGAMLLRSLIFRLLTTHEKPTQILDRWVYQGKVHTVPRGRFPAVRTWVPPGAEVAFDRLAREFRCRAPALLRGLILDYLGGRVTRLRVVTYLEMPGDPDRYLHPERFSGAP